jgi:adenylosuccinate synthase
MPVTILVGAQWGDEGKGRVADWFAEHADVVGRFAGGDNAGHTVRVGDDTFKLHLIPSGILHPSVQCILGAGTVINPLTILNELADLEAGGVHVTPQRLVIDPRAHIITPAHIALDGASETARGADKIGTTKRGIGPAYASKAARTGIRAGALVDPERFGDLLQAALEDGDRTLTTIYGAPGIADRDAKIAAYVDAARRLAPFVADGSVAIHRALEAGQRVLCEGAQGTLLDIDHGWYPFVTSSSPTAGGALTGLGFGPKYVDRVVGIAKAFSTRVGSGPFPTELDGALGDRLRGTGENPWDEFGTTTGRPRRCGWLDAVILRYAARVNGLTELIINKLDILSGFDTLKIAVAYEIDGRRIDELPYDLAQIERAIPIYETLPGWQANLMQVTNPAHLPSEAIAYLKRIEALVGVPISSVGVGPARDQMILLR